jgi:hypothetical protein
MRWTTFALIAVVSCLAIDHAGAEQIGPGSLWPDWPMVQIPLAKPQLRMQIRPATSSIIVDGQLDDWHVPALQSPKRDASFWFQYSDEGLQIAASMPALDAANGETLRFRLSLMPDVQLPMIGWPGTALASLRSCASIANQSDPNDDISPPAYMYWQSKQQSELRRVCEKFYLLNVQHRVWLQSQFQPEFVFDGSQLKLIETDYAPPTQHNLATGIAAPVVEPAATTQFKFSTRDSTVRIEWQLPWNGMPLTNQLQLAQVYLQIERCSGYKLCYSELVAPSANQRLPLELRLSDPKRYRVSECELPLLGMYRNRFYPGYFRPRRDAVIYDVIALATPFGGYFRGPDVVRRSPELTMYRYSDTKIAEDEFVCGPLVAHRIGKRLTQAHAEFNDTSKFEELNAGQRSQHPLSLVIQSINTELSLVMEPADFTFRSSNEGQGGAEATIVSTIWLLDRHAKKFSELYVNAQPETCWKGQVVESFELSEDLRKLTITRRQCRDGYVVEEDIGEKTVSCFDSKQLRYAPCPP